MEGERETHLNTPHAFVWFWPEAISLSPHWLQLPLVVVNVLGLWLSAKGEGEGTKFLMLLITGCLKVHCCFPCSYPDLKE